MVEHQTHFGRKFYQDKSKGYWYSTDYPRIYAHRWVWINIHGIIPKGYHIHHKDKNKSNNSIENLELMERFRHLNLHANEENNRKRMRILAEVARPLTKVWHFSKEGIAWHKLHAIRCKFGKNEPIDYQCIQCGKQFKSPKLSNTKFCGNNCKSQWRRLSGVDNIELICEKCGIKFVKNKYDRKQTCGKDCKKNIREKKRDDAIKLRESGYTYQQIADELGISRKYASDLTNKIGSQDE